MALRPVDPDHLPYVELPQVIDQRPTKEKADHQGRQSSHDSPEGDVPEYIEQDQILTKGR